MTARSNYGNLILLTEELSQNILRTDVKCDRSFCGSS